MANKYAVNLIDLKPSTVTLTDGTTVTCRLEVRHSSQPSKVKDNVNLPGNMLVLIPIANSSLKMGTRFTHNSLLYEITFVFPVNDLDYYRQAYAIVRE